MPRNLADLHVHLEGTVAWSTAAELSARHALPPPPPYADYRDLEGFLAAYRMVAAGLRDASDLERVVMEHAEVMARDGIAYAEVSVNPSLHPGEGWIDGIVAGRGRARGELGVEIAWLVELTRGMQLEEAELALGLARSLEGCVGLGLVGDEAITAAPLAPIFDAARAAGLGVMPHAGQAGGPEAVREAVEVLGALRVAHGVQAIADPALVSELAARQVCLCVCPSSNRRIGLRPDYGALARAGVPLAVGSDDPAMVGTTLPRELELAERETGLDAAELAAAAWRHRFQPA